MSAARSLDHSPLRNGHTTPPSPVESPPVVTAPGRQRECKAAPGSCRDERGSRGAFTGEAGGVRRSLRNELPRAACVRRSGPSLSNTMPRPNNVIRELPYDLQRHPREPRPTVSVRTCAVFRARHGEPLNQLVAASSASVIIRACGRNARGRTEPPA